jgi:ABC-type glutathione transport system ATPase component
MLGEPRAQSSKPMSNPSPHPSNKDGLAKTENRPTPKRCKNTCEITPGFPVRRLRGNHSWNILSLRRTRLTVAMKDASMPLAHGEVVALPGQSGAGKSTFLTAESGRLISEGWESGANRSKRRETRGFLSESDRI